MDRIDEINKKTKKKRKEKLNLVHWIIIIEKGTFYANCIQQQHEVMKFKFDLKFEKISTTMNFIHSEISF
jgi:hypothetical protein